MPTEKYIACGMYAFSEPLRAAWQALFDPCIAQLGEHCPLRAELSFESGIQPLRSPELFFGHTCGYPLMTQLDERLRPFCVAQFDVPGCEGNFYSSHFIVPLDSDIDTLAGCAGKVVAINATDSNSGMNVLRYALARLGARPGFFDDVLVSGGHLHSLRAVAEGRAQLAAIDCVSYQLIADQWPELVARVRSIGFSERTCALPLVIPRGHYSQAACDGYVDSLNLALDRLSAQMRSQLHLRAFAAVRLEDYQSILDLEDYALTAGYCELN